MDPIPRHNWCIEQDLIAFKPSRDVLLHGFSVYCHHQEKPMTLKIKIAINRGEEQHEDIIETLPPVDKFFCRVLFDKPYYIKAGTENALVLDDTDENNYNSWYFPQHSHYDGDYKSLPNPHPDLFSLGAGEFEGNGYGSTNKWG
jgi:hypothetical protein